MKTKVKRWSPEIRSPWLTRSEAADYLRMSTRTLDRNLVRMQKERVPGKARFEVLESENKIKPVRILAQDVYAICPEYAH